MIWIILVLIGLLLLVGGFLIMIPTYRLQQKLYKKTGKHPKGHYMGMGIAMGIPIGIPIGIAMGVLPIGIAIGLALGVSIGTAMEKQHEKELRPLTKEEIELKRKSQIYLLGALALGVIAFAVIFLFGFF